MLITNTTDKNINGGVKVIGIGDYRILPGETQEIPDHIAYVNKTDANGRVIGREVLPSIRAIERIGQVSIKESAVPYEPKKSDEKPELKTAETERTASGPEGGADTETEPDFPPKGSSAEENPSGDADKPVRKTRRTKTEE